MRRRIPSARRGVLHLALLACPFLGLGCGDGTDLESLFEKAKQADRSGDSEESIRLYRHILDEDPNHAKARNNLGVAWARNGDLLKALEQFEGAAAANPDDPEIVLNLANALIQMGSPAAALAPLNRLQTAVPDDAGVRLAQGEAHLALENFKEAEAALLESVRLNPENARSQFLTGRALRLREQSAKAVEYYCNAIWLAPGDPEPELGLAKALFDQGRDEEGLAHAREAALLADRAIRSDLAQEARELIEKENSSEPGSTPP